MGSQRFSLFNPQLYNISNIVLIRFNRPSPLMYVPRIHCDGITRVQVSDLITAHVQYIIGTHEYCNIIMLHHNYQNNYLPIDYISPICL